MSSLRALLSETVDYAGLFPPASLDLSRVVANYHQYLNSDWNWMLARLIVPAGKLAELAELAARHWDGGPLWRISALTPGRHAGEEAVRSAWASIAQFNREYTGGALVDVIETRAASEADIEWINSEMPAGLSAFVEFDGLPATRGISKLSQLDEGFGNSRLFAKIRTGGVEATMIPEPAAVAGFLVQCGQQLVPFKATAGLHHPLCGDYRLTYAEGAPSGRMYGYLNMFVAATLVYSGIDSSEIVQQVLVTSDLDEFTFQPGFLGWKDYRIATERVAAIRRRFAFSFGSCSFEEPTSELPEPAAASLVSGS